MKNIIYSILALLVTLAYMPSYAATADSTDFYIAGYYDAGDMYQAANVYTATDLDLSFDILPADYKSAAIPEPGTQSAAVPVHRGQTMPNYSRYAGNSGRAEQRGPPVMLSGLPGLILPG